MLGATSAAMIALHGPFTGRASAQPASSKPLLGIDYYPEQTDPDLWEEDVRKIRDLGATFVRMAEFAWSDMEPSEGSFYFGWLEKSVDMFHVAGLDVVLGTPSAAPPPWLTAKYPQVMMVTKEGVRLSPGSRRSTCPTIPLYRELSSRIASAMVNRFARRPGIIGWQIDNEPSLGGGRRCYCEACRSGFQRWLENRYGSLAHLNAAWGTSFWSAKYNSFAQIPVPVTAMGSPNPGLALDYSRFQSDSWDAFIDTQVAVVRAGTQGHFITSNNVSIPGADVIHPHDMTDKLDFFSVDTYPSFFVGYFSAAGLSTERPPAIDTQVAIPAFLADAARSAKPGVPFMVMEQQVGKTGFGQVAMSPQPERGQIYLWSLQNIAHGSRGFSYFRWDTPRTGQEQLWHGLVNFDRSPTEAYDEVRRAMADTKSLGPIITAPLLTDIAVLSTMDTAWAYDTQPITSSPGYRANLFDWYVAATQRESAVDVIASARFARGHRVVLAPSMLVASDAEAEEIQRFVAAGGIFIAGCRSGWFDEKSQVAGTGFPGALRELMGVKVDQYTPLAAGASSALTPSGRLAGLGSLTATGWIEKLAPNRAEVIATWGDGPYSGAPAVTVRSLGAGHAIYVGGTFARKPLRAILERLIYGTSAPAIQCPPGVELTRRGTRDRHAVFLLNHNGAAAAVEAGSTRYRDRLRGEWVSGRIAMAPYQVRVLDPA
jgi:beta-galactosidase